MVSTHKEQHLLKIPLDLLQGQKQQHFFDYFKAALRRYCPLVRGNALIQDDGSHITNLEGDFSSGNTLIPIKWSITRQSDGTILFIEISPINIETAPINWESIIQNFITKELLIPTLAEKTKKCFHRNQFHYLGTVLDGEYWLPKFRLAPALPDDSIPMMVFTERVIYIEQEVQGIDYEHARLIAEENAKRYAARLSLILNTGLYRPENGAHKWFLKPDPEFRHTTTERWQLGFRNPSPLKTALPKKGVDCQLGAYKDSVLDNRGCVLGSTLACPKETRKILRALETQSQKFKDAFDSCARLYQVALTIGNRFPSVSLAYQIAAVEAITKTGFSEYKGFSDFMRQNLPQDEGINKVLDWLYSSVRSAHFHAGAFPLGEFLAQSFDFLDWETHDLVNKQFSSHAIIRHAIMSWVLKEITSIE